MPNGKTTGRKRKLYRDSAGSWASPTWALLNLRNLKLSFKKDKAEAGGRESDYKKYLNARKDAMVTFDIVRDVANADFQALQTAFLNDAVITIAIASGPIASSGTRYLKMDVIVTDFSTDEPLDDADTVSVELSPAAESDNEPAWITVA